MNKSLKSSHGRSRFTLGDLIAALSSSSRNSREIAAALTDLVNSKRVCLSNRRQRLRVTR